MHLRIIFGEVIRCSTLRFELVLSFLNLRLCSLGSLILRHKSSITITDIKL